MNMIYRCISGINDPDLKSITEYLIRQNEPDFRKWSAAKSVHHNYLNGLLSYLLDYCQYQNAFLCVCVKL